jgi:two-component system sensor histidine kinase FlrB
MKETHATDGARSLPVEPSARELQTAFEAFNQISERLTSSYRELQEKVVRLNEELARARSEKLQQLAEKERLASRLQRLLEALPGGVLVLDDTGVIREMNPGAGELLGEPLLGESWEAVARRVFVPGSQELRLHDGRWLSLSSRSLEEGEGRIVLLADVTETRRLQEMVNHNRRLAALGEMSATLAHQIRTPLASVLLYLSQLDSPALDAQQRSRFASRARERLDHLGKMVDNMLAYARGGSTCQEPVNLEALVHALRRILEPQLEARRGTLEVRGICQGVALLGNQDALLGALVNLGMNAMEACDGPPRLELVLAVVGQELQLALSDNGRGIPAELLEQVFEPFFTTRSDGTGLGLAVVKAVIEGHGGELEIQSRSGRGTRVKIRLPLSGECQALPAGTRLSGYDPGASRNEVIALKKSVEAEP